MANVISRWIEDRLGIVIQKFEDDFAYMTQDGYLLCQLLKSYGIITKEDLAHIKSPENAEKCLGNFNLIAHWLGQIDVGLTNDEICEIVNVNGMTSLNLFFKVYLALHDKTGIDFAAQKIFGGTYSPDKTLKFIVDKVPEDNSHLFKSKRNSTLEDNFDVIQWHRDRLEMMLAKCKLAREDYVHVVKNRERRKSSFSWEFQLHDVPQSKKGEENKSLVESLDFTYKQQYPSEKPRIENLGIASGNPEKNKNIMKEIQNKHKTQQAAEILKRELQKEILWTLWQKVKDEEIADFDKNIIDTLLKQSLYEKQMLCKVREVKIHKETIMEGKQIIADKINKEKEREFIDKVFGFDSKAKVEEFQYYFEKERSLELHRSIYEKKLKLRQERCYKMCSKIVEDICHYAINESEYVSYYGESPRKSTVNSWKQLFVSGISMEDSPVTPEELVQISEDEDIESIVQCELERQEKIDKQDFENYIHFEPPWDLETTDFDESILDEMKYGLNVIGSIVQRILETKYPLPPIPQEPDLPKMEIAVCINGLYHFSCIPILRKLLKYKNYEVFEMQDVINFCINAYKEEMAVDIVETYDPTESKSIISHKVKKGFKSKLKIATEQHIPGNERNHKEIGDKAEKKIQTPKYFPCEEIVFTHQAELGKIAEEELTRGKILTDFLLIAMFVEYLKSKTNIKGWVLINFPNTHQQTILLEQALSGKEISDEIDAVPGSMTEIADLEWDSNNKSKNQNDELRCSKLLQFPIQQKETNKHVTVLTGFIKLFNEEADEEMISNRSEENRSESITLSSNVEKFYIRQGCFRTMSYSKFDFFTIKNLAKLIVENNDLTSKSSVELFGDSVKLLYSELGIDRAEKEKSAIRDSKKVEKPEKLIKKSMVTDGEFKEIEEGVTENVKKIPRKSKSFIAEREDKFTQIPEVDEAKSEEKVIADTAKAGEAEWKYVELTPPDDLQNILASLWESTEETYVVDFSQILFLKRVLMNNCMPLVKYIKDQLKFHFTKPNTKQITLRAFQNIYNVFDSDIRNDEEFKAEYHCRIKEVRENLLDICDNTMLTLEQERILIIHKVRIPVLLLEITNNYINAFQLELDRSVDTLNLLNDYYTGIVTKIPFEETIVKELLPKVSLEDPIITKDVIKCLKDSKETSTNPLVSKIEEIMSKCMMHVHKAEQEAFAAHGKIKLFVNPSSGSAREKKFKGHAHKNSKLGTQWQMVEPDDEVKEQFEKISEEWICGIIGETARVSICLKLLKRDLLYNINDVFDIFTTTFQDVHEEIRCRYDREVKYVEDFTTLMAKAVEAEYPIHEELIFRDDEFFVDTSSQVLLEKPKEKLLTEPIDELAFTTLQLDKICDVLFDLAPSGFIAERSLAFLLQDILSKDDNQYDQQVPLFWSKLSSDNINKLSLELFGDMEYVPWREFIISNLLLPYPDMHELLKLRKQFINHDQEVSETISEDYYGGIRFWFESSTLSASRATAIKNLLFKLYKCNGSLFNYTAMLMDLCKGQSIPEGFGKAVAVCMGKPVCWDAEIGRKFVEITLEKRKQHDCTVERRSIEIKENLNEISQLIDEVVTAAVHLCESVIIEEIQSEKVKASKPKGGNRRNISNLNLQLAEAAARSSLKVNPKLKNYTKVRYKNDVEGLAPQIYSKVELVGSSLSLGSLRKSTLNKSDLSIPKVSVDHEVNLYPVNYFLTFDIIKDILSVVFWNVSIQNIEDKSVFELAEEIFNESRSIDFNFAVLIHEYLNNPKFLDLIKNTTKFLIKNPVKIVENLIKLDQQCTGEV